MRRTRRVGVRAHVGESAGDDAASAFKAVDDTINQIVGEKQGLQTRVNELEALLDQRYTPPAPRASGKTVNADVLAAEAAEKEARQAPAAPVAPPAPESRRRRTTCAQACARTGEAGATGARARPGA